MAGSWLSTRGEAHLVMENGVQGVLQHQVQAHWQNLGLDHGLLSLLGPRPEERSYQADAGQPRHPQGRREHPPGGRLHTARASECSAVMGAASWPMQVSLATPRGGESIPQEIACGTKV